jgi:hypothetical protein
MFRIIKWKHMFMKADMTRDINALRCNVKTSTTRTCGEGQEFEPSTKPKTPWPRRYSFICINSPI